MHFQYCIKHMIHEGLRFKRAEWEGYWEWKDGTILMHCAEGRVLDIRKTEDVAFTLENILASDWMRATPSNCPVMAREMVNGIAEAGQGS